MSGLPRFAFFASLFLALVFGSYLAWLWQPERQVSRHTDNLFRAIENRNWKQMQEFISAGYVDQWQNNSATLQERTRAVFSYVRGIKLNYDSALVTVSGETAHWQSRIVVSGNANEGLYLIQDRVNSLSSPFDLEWRHASWRPWDWKLVRVSNQQLAIPELGD